jgi:glutathionylspermidine synthase
MRLEPWPTSPSQEREIMDTLRFRYYKWDLNACGRCLVLPSSLVLNPAEHAQAVAISERFASILDELERKLIGDEGLLRALAIPESVIPLIRAEQRKELQLARYDLFLTTDGSWMVSEFNEDVPGGFNEACGLADLLGPMLHETHFGKSLRESIVDAFSDNEHVVFMFATGYSEDLQHMLVVRRWLEEAGHSTELASPAHLKMSWGRPTVFGRGCDAAIRFYPAEWFKYLQNHRDWTRAMPDLPVMNPLSRLVRQSKRIYAIWSEPGLLNASDLDFVLSHTPETVAAERWGRTAPPKNDWVLKHAFGRMGDTVIMGNLVTAEEWQRAWNTVLINPSEWIVQRRFEVSPRGSSAGLLFPSVGTYMVNGKFAGYYSRSAADPFINH